MGESREQRIEALLSEGLNHYGAGEVAEAVACWEEVLRLDPEHADALDYLQTVREDETQQAESPDAGTPTRVEDAGEPDPAAAPEDDVEGLLERAQEVLGRGDLEGALDLFRAAAERDPQRIEIEGYIDSVRGRLLKTYREQVGDTRAVPRLLVDPDAVTRFDLAPEAGFVLSLVDGTTTIEELIALLPMDAFEAYRILNVLLDAEILAVEPVQS